VIGTVNASEFLITLAVSITFIVALVTGHWQDAGALSDHAASVAGLVVGGIVAAPLAGWMVKAMHERTLLRLVGCLIMLLALFQTVQQLGFV
jgi:uncharacterized membrane protein YfcA